MSYRLITSVCLAAAFATNSCAAPAPAPPQSGVNIVRNASFELNRRFNGTEMRQANESYQVHVKAGKKTVWSPLPVEAWWARGPADGIEVTEAQAHSGKRSLLLQAVEGQPRSAVSSFDRRVGKGPVTLSAWVKTAGAKGRIDLDLVTGWRQAMGRSAKVRKSIELAADSDWTRLTITAQVPATLEAVVRLTVTQGSVYLDDVQIETAAAPSAFNVRPQEWVRLEFADHDNARLPKWLEADPATRKVLVHNDSRDPLTGKVKLFVGPWNDPTRQEIAAFDASSLERSRPRTVSFKSNDWRPDAYVVSLSLESGGSMIVDGRDEFTPRIRVGGKVSNSMLASRSVVRFAIASKTPMGEIFGVGNGMLANVSWWSGYSIDEFVLAREIGLVCSRGRYNDDLLYVTAAGGMPSFIMLPYVDYHPPKGSAFANPAHPNLVDIYHPDGAAFIRERAEKMGREFGSDPMVASFGMAGERPYSNGNMLCPSTYADADFRKYCKGVHGGLATLNKRWKTSYTGWDQVEQIVSARFIEQEKRQVQPTGAAAIDWTASTGRLSKQVVKRMFDNPGQAMDWMRWRTRSAIWLYSTYRKHARKYDTKTLYGNNLAFPAFWPQIFMPLTRAMDACMLDLRYTAGFAKSNGTPYEMRDCLEMGESADPGKPLVGIEVYVQPSFPAEYVALQNWGMLAHGMTTNLVFAWKPYADAGPVKETRAWEKPGAPKMWFMIDNDGTRLPQFETNKRSAAEIASYHRRFNGLSIKRPPADVALYVSGDTSEYVGIETANRAWRSFWQRTRNNLIYLLRAEGIAVDYVDDATLPDEPGRFKTIVVPASYVLSQAAAGRLARFAKAGGTVVLAGVCGIYDPWLNKYDNLGGPAWAELNWLAPNYQTAYTKVAFSKELSEQISAGGPVTAAEKTATINAPPIDKTIVEGKTFRGVNLGELAGGRPIKDALGNTVGWTRRWGKGRLIAYGIFPDVYSTNPHPPVNMVYWVRQMIRLGKLEFAGRWVAKGKPSVAGHLGTGAAVVEVVVRQKSDDEKFVFCFNQGGSGDGILEVALGKGTWRGEDVVTGKQIPARQTAGGTWSRPMSLAPWEYRILRLTRR